MKKTFLILFILFVLFIIFFKGLDKDDKKAWTQEEVKVLINENESKPENEIRVKDGQYYVGSKIYPSSSISRYSSDKNVKVYESSGEKILYSLEDGYDYEFHFSDDLSSVGEFFFIKHFPINLNKDLNNGVDCGLYRYENGEVSNIFYFNKDKKCDDHSYEIKNYFSESGRMFITRNSYSDDWALNSSTYYFKTNSKIGSFSDLTSIETVTDAKKIEIFKDSEEYMLFSIPSVIPWLSTQGKSHWYINDDIYLYNYTEGEIKEIFRLYDDTVDDPLQNGGEKSYYWNFREELSGNSEWNEEPYIKGNRCFLKHIVGVEKFNSEINEAVPEYGEVFICEG